MCRDCACGHQGPPDRAHHPSVAHQAPLKRTGVAATLQVPLGLRLLEQNDRQAQANRQRFEAAGVTVVNILSSPGSGTTALLEAATKDWGEQVLYLTFSGRLQSLAEQQLRGCDGGGKDLRGLELEAPPVEGGRVGGVRG